MLQLITQELRQAGFQVNYVPCYKSPLEGINLMVSLNRPISKIEVEFVLSRVFEMDFDLISDNGKVIVRL